MQTPYVDAKSKNLVSTAPLKYFEDMTQYQNLHWDIYC